MTAASGKGMYNSNEAKTDPDKLVDAPNSICPKGWGLPTSGRQMDNAAGWPFDRDDSFYRLLYAYGYPKTGDATTGSSTPVYGWSANSWGGGASAAWHYVEGIGAKRIMLSPMYFVHGGMMDIANGRLVDAGSNGDCWSKTPIAAVGRRDGLVLHFWNSDVYPGFSINYLNGVSVRCVAK